MLGLNFSSKLDWDSYITSTAKTASKKTGALIRCMKFLSPEVALYLYKSTICPCMEYCFQVWADVPSCYMELLNKLHKRIWRTLGPLLAASLELLAHYWNAANFSIGITLIEVFQKWHNWFQFVFLEGGLLLILIDCTIFLSPFLDATRMSMSRVSFCAKLDCLPINSLPKECFPLTYNLTLSLELTDNY